MSMLGLRDLLLITPTSSLHQHQQQCQQQQQQQQQPISSDHHHHHHHHHVASNLPLPSSAALSVGLGFFPVLTATPCIPPHHHPHNHNTANVNENQQECCGPNYWNLKMCPEVVVAADSASTQRKGGVVHVAAQDESGKQHLMVENHEDYDEENESNGIYGSESDFRVCQDCGNRAKKDCSFTRCRTCCKARGYHCTTHVRSTWVPASRRRDRDTAAAAAVSGSDAPEAKRPRTAAATATATTTTSHSSTSNATKSLDITSSHQDGGLKGALPCNVRVPAVFRCHRVSGIGIGNGEDEFAYLATVKISGHVFKGFLYDQGVAAVVDGKNDAAACVSELQLGNKNTNGHGECSSAAAAIATTAYPASAC